MSIYKSIIRPILFRVDPERVHDLILKLLPLLVMRRRAVDPILSARIAGLNFESPVGLAAGFDKDAMVFKHMYARGFGSIEVGTLTPQKQDGNPKPRIERLASQNAVINKMGFPNSGLDSALSRLSDFSNRPGPLGVNIGANKSSIDRIADYITGYRAVADVADYVTVNVSSPNTPGLREFEKGSHLTDLLTQLDSQIDVLKTPVFLKVSPDLTEEQIKETCDALLSSKIAAVIVGNTTVQRPHELGIENLSGGGLSGQPLAPISELALVRFYHYLQGRLPIISVGGITNANDVYKRICLGANSVQLYTSFIYEGQGLVNKINMDLAILLKKAGHVSISSAVGCSKKSQQNDAVELLKPAHFPFRQVAHA